MICNWQILLAARVRTECKQPTGMFHHCMNGMSHLKSLAVMQCSQAGVFLFMLWNFEGMCTIQDIFIPIPHPTPPPVAKAIFLQSNPWCLCTSQVLQELFTLHFQLVSWQINYHITSTSCACLDLSWHLLYLLTYWLKASVQIHWLPRHTVEWCLLQECFKQNVALVLLATLYSTFY